MLKFLVAAALVALLPIESQAQGELDNETTITAEQAQLAANLPATLVVRTNTATGAVEVMHSDVRLEANESSRAAVEAGRFTAMDVRGSMTGELDRDSSSSSWYFCYPNYNWHYPTYYYGGYSYGYSNYYNYGWGGWNYSYYNWGYRW